MKSRALVVTSSLGGGNHGLRHGAMTIAQNNNATADAGCGPENIAASQLVLEFADELVSQTGCKTEG